MLNLKQLRRKLLYSLIFGAVVFISLSFYANFSELRVALASFPLYYLPILLGLSFCNYCIRFVKWDYYISILEISISRGQSFAIFLAGLIMSISPGKFGEVLKSFLLKSVSDTPISRSAPIVVAERLTDFMGLIILVMLGLTSALADRSVIVISLLIVTILLVTLSSPRLSNLIIRLLKTAVTTFFGEEEPCHRSQVDAPVTLKEKIRCIVVVIPHKLEVAYESISCLITVKRLIWTTALSVVSWTFEGIAFILLLHAFNFDISPTEGIFIYSFSVILGALTMLPGGVGLTETSLSGLLILEGLSKPVSVAVTLIIRITTLWFAVAIGAFVLSWFLNHYGADTLSLKSELRDAEHQEC